MWTCDLESEGKSTGGLLEMVFLSNKRRCIGGNSFLLKRMFLCMQCWNCYSHLATRKKDLLSVEEDRKRNGRPCAFDDVIWLLIQSTLKLPHRNFWISFRKWHIPFSLGEGCGMGSEFSLWRHKDFYWEHSVVGSVSSNCDTHIHTLWQEVPLGGRLRPWKNENIYPSFKVIETTNNKNSIPPPQK